MSSTVHAQTITAFDDNSTSASQRLCEATESSPSRSTEAPCKVVTSATTVKSYNPGRYRAGAQTKLHSKTAHARNIRPFS